MESGDDSMGYMKLNVDVKSIEKTRTGENKRGNVNADEKQCDLAQGHKVDDCITDSASVNKKRKCEYHLDMLKWICKVAKDPCNHAIEHLPDKSRWRYYGREQPWKKVLLARERMLLKKNAGRSSEPSVWQVYIQSLICLNANIKYDSTILFSSSILHISSLFCTKSWTKF